MADISSTRATLASKTAPRTTAAAPLSGPGQAGFGVHPLRYRWHQLRTVVGFVQFGLTALFVAFVVAPLLRWRSGAGEQGELAVQGAIRRAYALSVGFWRLLGLVRVDAGGIAGLAAQAPCIVVANHPTLIDVVLLGSRLPQMDCIVNAGWTAHSPFLARAIEAAGYVRNDAGPAMVHDCAARLRRGRLLLVFPEGTRSPWGSFGKFHRGAAHISLVSGAPVVAVSIRCRPRMAGSGRKWHEVAGRGSRYELRIAGRLDPADYRNPSAGDVSLPIAARRMTDDLLSIFLQEPDLADA